MIKVVRVGEHFPDITHLGQVLPVETEISSSPGSHEKWTQTAPRLWTTGGERAVDPYYMNMPMYLRTVPDMTEVEVPPITASEFRWHLRDAALGAAERSGVHIPPVMQMATQFGAPDPRFVVGGVVSSYADIKRLPVGTVYYRGHPSKPNLMDVWEWTGDEAKHLLGPQPGRSNGVACTIHSMPQAPSYPDEPPADDLTLSRIALRAWRIGKVFKKKQGWCSVFEQTLSCLGISSQTLTITGESSKGPGDEVNREEAALLPEGSLLWWAWQNKVAGAVYVRDNKARNKALTRRLWGYADDLENSHERMVVTQTPDEQMAWNVTGSMLSRMPEGVRYQSRIGPRMRGVADEEILSHHLYSILEWPV